MSTIAKVAGGAVSEVRGRDQNSTQRIQKETTCQQTDLTLLELREKLVFWSPVVCTFLRLPQETGTVTTSRKSKYIRQP